MQIKFKTGTTPMKMQFGWLSLGKKAFLAKTTSWHRARFFCVFSWDLLKEAKFHLFAS